jgi:hypothetical protein
LGPSLDRAKRPRRAGVEYLPPARRGDIARAAERFERILLVDGVFHHDLAPSPREVCDAAQVRRLFGAASMGALRAAECGSFGMRALGIIARWYASEVLDGDDEVAVLFDPATERCLSVPCVNVRYLARLAQRRGALGAHDAERLIRRSRDVFYMDRTWDTVLACADPPHQRALRALIPLADLKAHDALFALRYCLKCT